jgi:hypothetical protein
MKESESRETYEHIVPGIIITRAGSAVYGDAKWGECDDENRFSCLPHP